MNAIAEDEGEWEISTRTSMTFKRIHGCGCGGGQRASDKKSYPQAIDYQIKDQ